MAGPFREKTMLVVILLLPFVISLSRSEEEVFMCDSMIYCQGPILEAVNRLQLYNDSKYYVDMPLKKSPSQTLDEFKKAFPDVKNIKKDALQKFMDDHFYEPDGELEKCKPDDWVKEPYNLRLIQDKNYRQWAIELNEIWLKLCRKIPENVEKDFSKNSLLYVPNNFIAPGGRFREYYYWDTYWIIKGLLFSGMTNTSRDIIHNFAWLIDKIGFIPNGGRVYYKQRSQPPFFTPMVYEYYDATGDTQFVQDMMPYMKKELDWWYTNRTVDVEVDGKKYSVYRYATPSNTPRPEMYAKDLETAEDQLHAYKNTTKPQRQQLYRDIATGAESGLDFGSRIFADRENMYTIHTSEILPVDLNALLCWAHEIMHTFHMKLGDLGEAKKYADAREDFRRMLDAVFYNETMGSWFDRDLHTNRHNTRFYPSNAAPLFTSCFDPLDTKKPRRMYEYMKEAGALDFPGGIPSSMDDTDPQEQWDLPNGWPPQNHMIIEGFRKSDDQQIQEHAYQIAERWIKRNYLVYMMNNKSMFEKYNVSDESPQAGGGGEYDIQVGFGWTNGVVLDLLSTYGSRLKAPPFEGSSTGTAPSTSTVAGPTKGASTSSSSWTSFLIICLAVLLRAISGE